MIKSGFSLMEILVASVSFVVVFMGIAVFLQSSMIMSNAAANLNSCIRHYKDGVRLLIIGDPVKSHVGLIQASAAYLCPVLSLTTPPEIGVATWIEYFASNATYQVWLRNGQLFRNRDGNATQTILGEAPSSVETRIARVVATWAVEPWSISPNPGFSKVIASVPLRIFWDMNSNEEVDGDEIEFQVCPTVYLRNSD